MKLRRSLGFTLIELIIVIGILGSITAIAAPNVLGTRDTAEEEACRDQMDFILQGFQNEQLYPDSDYAFVSVTDGTAEDGVHQLDKYIAKAIDPAGIAEIGFEDPVTCPSGTTDYVAAVGDDGRLYVYCNEHEVFSHTGLRGRAPKVDPTVYDTGDGWTGYDDNMIVGDHESLLPRPIPSEYFHMEIKVRLVLYDDGVVEEGLPPYDEVDNPSYEYRYMDPEYYWPINTDYYAVNIIDADSGENEDNEFDADRPKAYDLGTYNPTNEDLFFGMVIDYQDHGEQTNFTSNALEVKNVNSNAGLDMELDLVERDEFNSQESSHATHERNLMDSEGDWFIIDVIEVPEDEQPDPTQDMKRMVIHMQQDPDKNDESHFAVIFDALVPIADPDKKVQFAFFIGKRDVENSTKVGQYYMDSYPTPVQAWIQEWGQDFVDYGDSNPYKDWIQVEYKGYDGSGEGIIPDLDLPQAE